MRLHNLPRGERLIANVTLKILFAAVFVHVVLQTVRVNRFPSADATDVVLDFQMSVSDVRHHHGPEHERLRAVRAVYHFPVVVLSRHMSRPFVMTLETQRTDQTHVFLFDIVLVFLMRFQFAFRFEFLAAFRAQQSRVLVSDFHVRLQHYAVFKVLTADLA